VQAILQRQPTAMLLNGDMAVQDRDNHLGLHRADYLLRDFFPAWKKLVASVPIYATWDDHDYFANDKAGIPAGFVDQDRMNVRQVFVHSWNNPDYGFGRGGGGVFFRTRIGPCDIIMIDERFFRENKPGSFLGEKQMAWLQRQLLDCNGPFIILSSGTMWSDYVSYGKDSWGRWDPEGRESLFHLIEKKRIPGVLLISGDRHGARGFRIPRPSGFDFYEFEVAGLGGRSGPPVTDTKWNTQLYGVADVYAFGEFTFDTTLKDPRVTFRLIRENGMVLYELSLNRSQLTPPVLLDK
jgi:alkaline phosphatase D